MLKYEEKDFQLLSYEDRRSFEASPIKELPFGHPFFDFILLVGWILKNLTRCREEIVIWNSPYRSYDAFICGCACKYIIILVNYSSISFAFVLNTLSRLLLQSYLDFRVPTVNKRVYWYDLMLYIMLHPSSLHILQKRSKAICHSTFNF